MIQSKSQKPLPMIGLGTYPLLGDDIVENVINAIQIGYRIIDTSDDYLNEPGIGIGVQKAIASGLVAREDLFLQTKLSDMTSFSDDYFRGVYFNRYSQFMKSHTITEVVEEKVNDSLRFFKTDYLDSVLIHLPYYHYYEYIWEALCNLKAKGVIRYIGVSNCHASHIEQLSRIGESPSINEIYVSPIGTKERDILYCKQKGIVVMSYSPLIDIVHNRIKKEKFICLSEKYKKSLAQLILRWNVDRGILPLPKSSKIERLKENFNIFDFKLTPDEINVINTLNNDYQYLIESKICPGI